MQKTTRRVLIAPIALSMIVAMSACASDDDSSDSGSADNSSASSETTAGSAESATGSGSSSGDDNADDAGASSAPAAGSGSSDDTTARGLAAIATAESATGGVAYEIDDEDDDETWEVDVRVGDSAIEVKVSGDGAQVLDQENEDLDDDDKAALDAASITLSDAIQTAVEHAGGKLDDAELEGDDNGNPHHWEVSVDIDQQDDVEVHVSVSGEVIGTDD